VLIESATSTTLRVASTVPRRRLTARGVWSDRHESGTNLSPTLYEFDGSSKRGEEVGGPSIAPPDTASVDIATARTVADDRRDRGTAGARRSARCSPSFGPTASGKSAVAEAAADGLGTEVVSVDALQVYRGLPILTNQPATATRLVGIRRSTESR
jgi:hypothetical protein